MKNLEIFGTFLRYGEQNFAIFHTKKVGIKAQKQRKYHLLDDVYYIRRAGRKKGRKKRRSCPLEGGSGVFLRKEISGDRTRRPPVKNALILSQLDAGGMSQPEEMMKLDDRSRLP